MVNHPNRRKPRFIVLVQRGDYARAFGPYQSFKSAEGDAQAWGGFVLPVEKPSEAAEPWNAAG